MSVEPLNLLPPRRRSSLRLLHRLQVWTAAATAYALATAGACITLAAGEPVVDRHESTELNQLTSEVDSLHAETSRIKKDIVTENHRKQDADLVSDHPDWSILLDLLAATRGGEVVLEGLDVRPGVVAAAENGKSDKEPGPSGQTAAQRARPRAFDVRLTGIARTQTAVTEFADRLQRCGVFDRVSLERSSARANVSVTVIEYTILCHLGTTSVDTAGEPQR